jgi:hypothetical protein
MCGQRLRTVPVHSSVVVIQIWAFGGSAPLAELAL